MTKEESNEQSSKKSIVDLYCRVSGDIQEDNTSLDEQERVGRQFCKENGLIVGMVHREVWSGYQYRERKKLELMRQRYRDGKIKGVVIRTLDRLSRSQTHVAILMEEMEHHTVTLYSVKEVIDETPMGKFARMVLAFVAEMEREKIMDRTITGRVNKAKEGKIVSGVKPLYGWKWNNPVEKDFLIHDEKQARVLREAAQDYVNGISVYHIVKRLEEEGVPPPKGERWLVSTLRRILTDPRMTGKNVKLFTKHGKNAKQPLSPVDLPDGTYPAILSDEVYAKVLERATNNAKDATRNSKEPESFLLRSGFVRCSSCKWSLIARIYKDNRKTVYYRYTYRCSNPQCSISTRSIPSKKLDSAVWNAVAQLADHVALLEESVEFAMKSHTVENDLKAVEAALQQAKIQAENYEEDLKDPNLRGNTRAGIRNLLNTANALVEDLETQKAELEIFAIDREKERVEFDNLLDWCRKVKSEREELTYTQKRDFLRMLGVVVVAYPLAKHGAEPTWDIRVALPAIQEIIYQSGASAIGNPTTCCNRQRV